MKDINDLVENDLVLLSGIGMFGGKIDYPKMFLFVANETSENLNDIMYTIRGRRILELRLPINLGEIEMPFVTRVSKKSLGSDGTKAYERAIGDWFFGIDGVVEGLRQIPSYEAYVALAEAYQKNPFLETKRK